MYQAIPKDDSYKDLLSSVVSIYKIIHHRGLLRNYFSEENFKTKFCSSKKILQAAVNLYCEGYVDSIFYFIIELEFNKAVNQNTPMSEEELCELTLAKELVKYIREKNPDAIYDLIGYTCTGSTRSELVPGMDWAERPI
jgi:hypothetical protein